MTRYTRPMRVRLGVALVALLAVGGGRDVTRHTGVGEPARGIRLERSPIVWIPGAWFWRGADPAALGRARDLCFEDHAPFVARHCSDPALFETEGPQVRIWVSGFGMDRTEVPQRAYARCVRASRCDPSRTSATDPRVSAPNHPVAGVTWNDAARYCTFAGGRLPTEAEWERAARGHDRRTFPWGVLADGRRANHGGPPARPAEGDDGYRTAAPVGAFPSGASPFGLLDLAGNVWEWTADRWAPDAYQSARRVDPRGPSEGGERVVRGGSWRSPRFQLRVTHRRPVPAGASAPDLGFRCAYDPR